MKRAIVGVAMVLTAAAGCQPKAPETGPGTIVCVTIDATGGTSELMAGDECASPSPSVGSTGPGTIEYVS